MSINTALNSALSGLTAESARLSSISSNVANSSTVGYKSSETDFESMVLGSGNGASSTAGASPVTRSDITTAGQIQSTGVNTDIAINGQGFMVVKDSAAATGGSVYLTQAGSFRPDANGNLVNAGGYFLQGQKIDASGTAGPVPQNLTGLSTVNINNLAVAAAPTTAVTFAANLPAADTAFSATTPTPSTSSMQYYDGLGTAQTLKFEFVPTPATAAGSPSTNSWTMNIYDSASSTPATPSGSATLTFASGGTTAGDLQSVTPTSGTYDSTAGTFSITTGGGTTLPINIGALGSPGGLTQLDAAYTTTKESQNGSGFGTLQGVTIGTNGTVTAAFSNGATRPIYQIDLAVVANPDGLTPENGGAYSLTSTSGTPQLFQAGTGPVGTTEAGSLEGSNVDLNSELTNLIATQRAYSSSAEVIQIAQQMLDVVNHLNQ
jgi:flagellar hook protein FlgE